MAARHPIAGRPWGKRPEDPFLRWIHDDPKRVVVLQMVLTIGMIVFWLLLGLGVIIAFWALLF